MQEEIKNKVAVITGAARGIGFAIAEELLKEGAKTVIIVDIIEDKGHVAEKILNSKYGDGKALFIKGDVTMDLDKIFKFIIRQYQTVHILVNSAGIGDETDIRKMFGVNSIALSEWSTKFFGHMRKDKGGSGGVILNLSSIYGYEVDPYYPFYKASKYAVMGFSKTLGHIKNYNVTNVKVVTICPGYTCTDMIAQVKPHAETQVQANETEHFENNEKQNAEDVAKAAIKFIIEVDTGTAWSVIGGRIQQV